MPVINGLIIGSLEGRKGERDCRSQSSDFTLVSGNNTWQASLYRQNLSPQEGYHKECQSGIGWSYYNELKTSQNALLHQLHINSWQSDFCLLNSAYYKCLWLWTCEALPTVAMPHIYLIDFFDLVAKWHCKIKSLVNIQPLCVSQKCRAIFCSRRTPREATLKALSSVVRYNYKCKELSLFDISPDANKSDSMKKL